MEADVEYIALDGRPVSQSEIPHRNLEATGKSTGRMNTTPKPIKINQASQTDVIELPYKLLDNKSLGLEKGIDDGYDKLAVQLGFTENERRQICGLTVRQMTNCIEHYTGVPKEFSYVIQLIKEKSGVSIPKIYLVLRKIRHNESFQILGDLFGVSHQNAERIFLTDVEKIAKSLRPFICCPASSQRSDGTVILQCFEMNIAKPSKALEEALSWSIRKQTTTIKYLIGCTTDGLIVFISEGFVGKISDNEMIIQSGFLDIIKKETHGKGTGLYGGGFEHSESGIFFKVSSVERSDESNGNLKLSKSIAVAKLTNVKAIKNIRNFAFLGANSSSLNHKRSSLIEHSIVIASALCNLKNK